MEFLVKDPEVLKAMVKRTEELLKSDEMPREFKEKLVKMLSWTKSYSDFMKVLFYIKLRPLVSSKILYQPFSSSSKIVFLWISLSILW